MDETPYTPPDRKVQGDSPPAKACLYVIKAIRFVADNADRELAGKIVAVVIALGYLVATVIHEQAVTPIVRVAVVLLVPLGLVPHGELIFSLRNWPTR